MPAMLRRQGMGLLLVVLVAVVVRLVYLLQIRESPFFLAPVIDADFYNNLAQSLARGEGTGRAPFMMPPLYPLALSGLYQLFGVDLTAAHLLQLGRADRRKPVAGELGFPNRVGWREGFEEGVGGHDHTGLTRKRHRPERAGFQVRLRRRFDEVHPDADREPGELAARHQAFEQDAGQPDAPAPVPLFPGQRSLAVRHKAGSRSNRARQPMPRRCLRGFRWHGHIGRPHRPARGCFQSSASAHPRA